MSQRKTHPLQRWLGYLSALLGRAEKHRMHGQVTIVLHGGAIRSVRLENTVIDPEEELSLLKPTDVREASPLARVGSGSV